MAALDKLFPPVEKILRRFAGEQLRARERPVESGHAFPVNGVVFFFIFTLARGGQNGA